MKLFPLFLISLAATALAHDHVEVDIHPVQSNQLALDGPAVQLAPYVPWGEPFSGYTPYFPGGCFASELTFTTENNILDIPVGADPEIELISVIGPTGGSFSFWEVEATSPTWSRASGWNQTATDRPSFPVILGGNNHLHGRAFSVDRPGEYQVTFRAVDRNGLFQNSADYTLTFRGIVPPPLSIRLANGQAVISFTSRLNLAYDLQICTDLSSGTWNLVSNTPIDGDGTLKETTLPLSHPRAFFRLIEFK